MEITNITGTEEYKSEIKRSEDRVASLRSEVNYLENGKRELQSDCDALDKHLRYLGTVKEQKEEEIHRKEETIKSIDAQIEARQKVADQLQQELGELKTLLNEKKEELTDTASKLQSHSVAMLTEHSRLSDLRKTTEENHRISDEKIRKLQAVLNEIT